jgi:hypothetical protein
MSPPFTRADVEAICRKVTPAFGYDPILILAVCEQESAWDPTAVRLENGFYRNYSRPCEFATTTEVLFSASYGLMQIMGLSLHLLGYFGEATQVGVVKGVDVLMIQPELQVRMGCAWLKVKELCGAGFSEPKAIDQSRAILAGEKSAMLNPTTARMREALKRYNGNAEYAVEVLGKYDHLAESQLNTRLRVDL